MLKGLNNDKNINTMLNFLKNPSKIYANLEIDKNVLIYLFMQKNIFYFKNKRIKF